MDPVTALIAISTVVGLGAQFYGLYRADPRKKAADYINAMRAREESQAAIVQGAQRKSFERFRKIKGQQAQDILEATEGVSSGRISGAQAGAAGGGLPHYQLPMVEMVAAKLGVDPQDLIARFDPRRSNIYIPASRRGAFPRLQPPQPTAPESGPSIVPQSSSMEESR